MDNHECNIEGCTTPVYSRGVCQSHYIYLGAYKKAGVVTDEKLVKWKILEPIRKGARGKKALLDDTLVSRGVDLSKK